METAKHFEEVNEDVAGYAASHPKSTSRAKHSWRRTVSGRRRARRVGSGLLRSSLPTVDDEGACDAFLDRIEVAEPDDFDSSLSSCMVQQLGRMSELNFGVSAPPPGGTW
eukprot:907741-Amphidinium_carterae.1